MFTAIQMCCLAVLWIIKSFKETSILFPVMVSTSCGKHREIFPKSYQIKPKSDCIYHFSIYLVSFNLIRFRKYFPVCGAVECFVFLRLYFVLRSCLTLLMTLLSCLTLLISKDKDVGTQIIGSNCMK